MSRDSSYIIPIDEPIGFKRAYNTIFTPTIDPFVQHRTSRLVEKIIDACKPNNFDGANVNHSTGP